MTGMRTDRWGFMALWAVAIGTSGCATTSIGADLARVRELTKTPILATVDAAEVEPEISKELRGMLREPLTADAAVRIALLNNRELRASLRELGIARGQYVQAGLLPNPAVGFDIRQSTDRTQPLQIDVHVEYDLTRAILAPIRAGAAQADLEAARYKSAASVIEGGFQVRAGFYAFQAAQQRLAIAARVIDAFAASRDAARALLQAGNVAELDVATQEAAYESARATVAQLELDMLEQRERLQRLLGLHGEETAWQVKAPLPSVPDAIDVPVDLERRALKASLELAETRSRLEAAARRTGLSRTEGWLPDIALDFHSEQDGRAFEIGGGARIALPIFDHKQGTTAAREAEFDAMMERYHGAAVDIRSAAREAKNRLRSAHTRSRQFQQVIVPARKRVLEQTLLQYNAMQVGVFQLLQARREQLDADLAHVETLRGFWTAKAALDALLDGRRVGAPSMAAPAGLANSPDSSGGH
jgi:outer membrane protein, heavy metal efflux system